MIVPGPARRRVDLESDLAAQALAGGYSLLAPLLPFRFAPISVIASDDEAIHFFFCRIMDCFASPAMTLMNL